MTSRVAESATRLVLFCALARRPPESARPQQRGTLRAGLSAPSARDPRVAWGDRLASENTMYEHLSAFQASVHHWVGLSADFFLYEHWDGPWFEKDGWEKLTKGTRIFLCMAGALLLIYEVRARRLREKIKERTRKRIAYLLTGLAFFVYFDFFNPNVRYEEYYHRHEFYHYYLGSKYSQELGYVKL